VEGVARRFRPRRDLYWEGGRVATTRPGASAVPVLDRHGRYRQRGRYSVGVVAIYVIFLLIVIALIESRTLTTGDALPWFLVAIVVFFLARYFSTVYTIDDTHLRAWRILGGRRVALSDVRKIEYSALRDLSPTGFFGAWGWRGRMWSPVIGHFDSVHTEAVGLLVTAGDVPLFVSPRDPVAFARELSRRVRSYSGRLSVDVGDPDAEPARPIA
jgi:hypothetical protein